MAMAARAVAASRTPAARSAAARFVQARPWSSGRKVPGEEGKAAEKVYMKRLTKLQERLDRLEAQEEKIQPWLSHYTSASDTTVVLDKAWDKLDRQTKAVCYVINGFSAFLVLRHLF